MYFNMYHNMLSDDMLYIYVIYIIYLNYIDIAIH